MAYEGRATVRLPRSAEMTFAAAVMLANVALGFFHVWDRLGSFGEIASLLLSLLPIPAMLFLLRSPRERTAEIRASAEGLRVDGKLYARDAIKTTLVVRRKERTFVFVRAKRSGVEVQVPDDARAAELTQALALDAKSAASAFALFRTGTNAYRRIVFGASAAFFAAVFGAVFLLPSHGDAIVPALSALVAFYVASVIGAIVYLRSRIVRFTVGADGIVVKRAFREPEFLPHDAIRGVRAEDIDVVLEPVRGAPMRFTTAQRPTRRRREPLAEAAQAIVRRIEEAREAYRQLAHAPDAALVLARGERSTGDWLRQLARLGEEAGATFREASVSREQLLRVVESTTAAATERLAALVALHSKLSDDERPRVRVAVERCVLPALRERMVRVFAAEDEEAIASVLEEAQRSEA